MKQVKVLMIMLLAGLIAAGAVFAGGQQGGGESRAAGQKPSYTFKWAEVNPAKHLMTYSAEVFKAELEKLSGGRLKVEIYPAMQLGDEKTTMQALQMGSVDFFRGAAVSMVDFNAKKMGLLALPFVFRDRPHLWAALNSPVGDELLRDVQESGSRMVAIGWFEEGARHFFFRNKEIKALADMKGLKIRVPQNELSMDIVRAYGASPTPISYSELYSSLQTGVIDGAENPIVGYQSNSFYEVGKYLAYAGYTFSPCPVMISEIVWNRLDQEDKDLILKAMKAAQEWNKVNSEKNENDALKICTDNGVQVTYPDVTEFQRASTPVYEKYGKDYLDLIAKIQAIK
jgi:tripartite ATP-independent transporter DctP family solute receptor